MELENIGSFSAANPSIKPLGDKRYLAEFNGVELTLVDVRTDEEIKLGRRPFQSVQVVDVVVPVPGGRLHRFKVMADGASNFVPFNEAIARYTREDPKKIALHERIQRAQDELEAAKRELEAL